MFEKSFNSIGDFAKRFVIFIHLLLFKVTDLSRRVFDCIIAFPSKDFQPKNASGWCTLFIQRALLQRESIERVLTGVGADSTILGSHSHVLVGAYLPSCPSSVDEIQTLTILKALWCHAIEAPFGIRITEAMCPTCGVLCKREVIHNSGDSFFTIHCKSRVQPPSYGPRGGAVPQTLPLSCPVRKVYLYGCHLDAPQGALTSNGTWYVAPYEWSALDGRELA